MNLPKIYHRDLNVCCDECGKITKIKVPYICEQHDIPCDEVYIKSGVEPKNTLYSCNCNGIKDKVKDEYLKLDSSFLVEH